MQRARACEAAGDRSQALALWRQVLERLPANGAESAEIRQHILALSMQERNTHAVNGDSHPWVKRLGPFGVVVAFLLKFKTVILLGLGKAKFLLFGLAKVKTLLSMMLFFGVYWSLYGWQFALGFVLGIYIHEMGHVWALRRFGMRASAPMFIPLIGAMVSLYQSPVDEGEDARIGLAGPLWGAGAGLFFALSYVAFQSPVLLAIAHTTAWLNLFNLIPVWQLDGGRGFRALTLAHRYVILGLLAALWFATHQGIYVLILLGGLYRVFWRKDQAPRPDGMVLAQFAGLLVFLGAMITLISDAGPFAR